MLELAALHARIGAIAGALALLVALPTTVAAGTPCDQYFQAMRSFAKADPKNNFDVFWTTNYIRPTMRFMGMTQLKLFFRGATLQDLVGGGTRKRLYDPSSTVNADSLPVREAVSLKIQLDGKVVFNDMYGPYDVTCEQPNANANPYLSPRAVVVSKDSIEVFTFMPSKSP